MKLRFGNIGGIVAGPRTKWITLVIWIVLAAALTAFLPSANHEENNNAATLPATSWSVQAEHVAKQYWPKQAGIPAVVVWHRPSGLTKTDLVHIKAVAANLERDPLRRQQSVAPLNRMPVTALRSLESKDGTTLVETVTLKPKTSASVLQQDVSNIQQRVKKTVGGDSPFATKLQTSGLQVRVTGPAGISADTLSLFAHVDVTLLLSTVLLVLILLILLYRSPLLAVIPLIGVGISYAIISPILGILAKSGLITIDAESISIMTVLLFGAGTDYCLFLIARYRERLYATQDRHQAMRQSVKNVAGAIGMSAMTVVISLLTLLLAKSGSIHRFAIPFSLAILVMALAGLTLVPALLAVFGRSSFFPFIPRTQEMEAARESRRGMSSDNGVQRKQTGRFGQWLGETVATKPWPILIAGLMILCGLTAFAPQMKTTNNPLAQLPDTTQSAQGYELVSNHFSAGSLAPVQVMVNTEGKRVDLVPALKRLPFVKSVSQPRHSDINRNAESVTLTLAGDPYSDSSIAEVPAIRKTVDSALQQAGVSHAQKNFWVGGETATQYDTQHLARRDTRVVIPIVLAIIAVLLILYLRSLIAMVYLIGTVVLSFFGALGAGWLFLHDVLGQSSLQEGIALYAFIFLVALGEDYNIFMVSRIWQERKTRPLQAAIAHGVSRTSGVITSAGLILAGTFAVLTGMPGKILMDFGVISAIGILLDTFVVRPLIVPSLISILGRFAFWPDKHRSHL